VLFVSKYVLIVFHGSPGGVVVGICVKNVLISCTFTFQNFSIFGAMILSASVFLSLPLRPFGSHAQEGRVLYQLSLSSIDWIDDQSVID
jgi:hypothetical protein